MNPLEVGWCLICMYRVADQIVEILEKAGVKRIYGIVGKNRFGRLGRIQFRWTAELTKYEEEQNYPVTNK